VKVQILANGEWERRLDNHWEGMPSPIKWIERHVEFLRSALQAYRDQLLCKIMFSQPGMVFSSVPFEILVAIADTGSIDYNGDFPEAVKADFVPDRVREIVNRHKRARGLFDLDNLSFMSNDGLYNFKDVEIDAMRHWFTAHHYPEALQRERAAQRQQAAAKASAARDYSDSH